MTVTSLGRIRTARDPQNPRSATTRTLRLQTPALICHPHRGQLGRLTSGKRRERWYPEQVSIPIAYYRHLQRLYSDDVMTYDAVLVLTTEILRGSKS